MPEAAPAAAPGPAAAPQRLALVAGAPLGGKLGISRTVAKAVEALKADVAAGVEASGRLSTPGRRASSGCVLTPERRPL